MNEQPEFELRYNITADGCETQRGNLNDLTRAAYHLVNLWEIRRLSDGVLVFAEDDAECLCGNAQVLRGWRVCLSCAEARLQCEACFADDPPDRLEGVESVPVEFLIWDLNHLHADDWDAVPAPAPRVGSEEAAHAE